MLPLALAGQQAPQETVQICAAAPGPLPRVKPPGLVETLGGYLGGRITTAGGQRQAWPTWEPLDAGLERALQEAPVPRDFGTCLSKARASLVHLGNSQDRPSFCLSITLALM